jgi:cytochrome P450
MQTAAVDRRRSSARNQDWAEMLRRVPGPKESALRQALAFAQDQYAFLERAWRRHGDVFTFRIPGEAPRLIVAAPAEVKRIFALRPDDYDSSNPGMHVNYGERCVLFNDGEVHRRDRQLLTPPLHGTMLEAHGAFMLRTADAVIDRWAASRTVVLHEALAEITMRVIVRCILGADDAEREAQLRTRVRAWLEETLSPAMFAVGSLMGLTRTRRYLDRLTELWLHHRAQASWLPLPGRTSARLKAEFVALLRDDIRQCRLFSGPDRHDVLALVAAARYEDGALMSEESVVDQLTLLLSAGHETTAKSMCWALLDMLTRPPVLTRIRAELGDAFGDGPIDPLRCRALPYLNAVIKESMRLRPVTTVVQRELTRAMEIGGHEIPSGVVLAPCNFLTQRHPSSWDEALRFFPERFMGNAAPAPSAYFPFGGGRRRCLGVEFALFEMPIVLATLLRRADLRLAPRGDHRPRYGGITIGPADGVRVIVDRVRPAPRATA